MMTSLIIITPLDETLLLVVSNADVNTRSFQAALDCAITAVQVISEQGHIHARYSISSIHFKIDMRKKILLIESKR